MAETKKHAATQRPGASDQAPVAMPREHGATAMLLIPYCAAALLLRTANWIELAGLVAVFAAFSIKDPLIVLARQRFVWKTEHPETKAAQRSVATLTGVLAASGALLVIARDWHLFVPFALGGAAFTTLAVERYVRNRQRSEWFQAASAVALSTTCFIACLATTGEIPSWCAQLWLACALQAAAGIFVVHSRLDARIASRKPQAEPVRKLDATPVRNRRAALACLAAMAIAAIVEARVGRVWIAFALLFAAGCYGWELRRQRDPATLQWPLTRIGLQGLAVSISYALIIVFGLWNDQ